MTRVDPQNTALGWGVVVSRRDISGTLAKLPVALRWTSCFMLIIKF